jgi:hypothetical protein
MKEIGSSGKAGPSKAGMRINSGTNKPFTLINCEDLSGSQGTLRIGEVNHATFFPLIPEQPNGGGRVAISRFSQEF